MLLDNLAKLGLSDADIDIVVLTHLHFDHAGGLLAAWEADQPPRLLFPKAQFITGKRHWQRASRPHPRDRASFIPELLELLQASGRLHLLDECTSTSAARRRLAPALERRATALGKCFRKWPWPTARCCLLAT